MPLPLVELQQQMMGAFYREGDASSLVIPNSRLTAKGRIEVYAGSVLGTLIDALESIYPVVKQLLGDEFFDAMSQRYIKKYPSKSYSLDQYGEHLAEFMSDFPSLKEHQYIAEVARLEWAYQCVFHAVDEAVLDAEKLASADPEQYENIVFQKCRAMSVMNLDAPAIDLWHAHQEVDSDPDLSEIDMTDADGNIVIWRREFDILMMKIDSSTADFLKLLDSEKKFGTICEEWLSIHPNTDMNSVLAQAIQASWIVDFKV